MLTPQQKQWKLLQAWFNNSLEIWSVMSPQTCMERKEESQRGWLSCELSFDKEKNRIQKLRVESTARILRILYRSENSPGMTAFGRCLSCWLSYNLLWKRKKPMQFLKGRKWWHFSQSWRQAHLCVSDTPFSTSHFPIRYFAEVHGPCTSQLPEKMRERGAAGQVTAFLNIPTPIFFLLII